MTPLPDEVHDFQSLVLWLAQKHHNGNKYQMAKRLGVGVSLISFWANGQVKRPTMRHIRNLCTTYKLNHDEVSALIAQRKFRSIDPGVSNFRSLIQWLAKEDHGGTYRAMAKRVGVSVALVYQWRDGVVNQPTLEHLRKLCRAYNLNESDVSARIFKRR
jgi:transcriptional regulator with XRE-family HTH domain